MATTFPFGAVTIIITGSLRSVVPLIIIEWEPALASTDSDIPGETSVSVGVPISSSLILTLVCSA